MLKSTIMSNGMLDRILKSSSIELKSTSIIYDKATLNMPHSSCRMRMSKDGMTLATGGESRDEGTHIHATFL